MNRQYFLITTNTGRNHIVSRPIGVWAKQGGRGYVNISELRKANGVLDQRCIHCNGLVVTHYQNIDDQVTRMIEKNHCNHCDFWLRKPIELPNSFRIDGYHYNNWSEYDEKGELIGYHAMDVTMIDTGEVIHVSRLTHQGDIPKRWRTLLPDNATKVSILKESKLGKSKTI